MQFFPVDATAIMNQTVQAAENLFSKAPEGSFGGVLSSFIEEGRNDYSGRPAGFSAYGPTSGTFSDTDVQRFSEALRKHGVDESLVANLEKLAASGSPVTLGSAYKALSGKGRMTEELEDGARDSFKSLLGRMGLSKEEQEELLDLSDEGDVQALAKRLEALFQGQEGAVELNREELQSLLRSLDLSQASREGLLASLAGGESITLDSAKLQNVLDAAGAEQSARGAAAQYAQKEMRGVMADILASRKAAELTSPVNDTRGNRLSEQSEAMMQNSIHKKTGLDELAAKANERGAEEENFESRKDGKSRSERILETAAESVTGKQGKENKETAAQVTPASRLAQRIDIPETAAAPQNTGQTQQTTNTTAANYRQEIFSQVQQGLLQSAQNGSQRLTLQLNPAELGQLTVVLSLHQGEVKATIRAENADAASVLREQMAELRQTLEDQGLKVKELDVQTGLQNNDFAGQWEGHREHNLMYDATERDRLVRLARIRRDAVKEQAAPERTAAPEANNGLHIVA